MPKTVHRAPAFSLCGLFFVLVGLLAPACSASAQTIVGRISGTVKDASGGVVPNVSVVITNEGTQINRSAVTDDVGFYVVTNLPVGMYSVEVSLAGFKKVKKTGFDLVADGRITADFTLEPGGLTEMVEVIAVAGETVNSVSGEIARVIDSEQVRDLALNGRNYLQLASLIPGAALLNEDQMELTTSLSISQQAMNGNRPNTNNLSLDGGFNMDSGSNNSQINNIGIDFIREVNIKTSNFSAEYGRNSGAAINVVTRGGESRYHGGLFEFLRNDFLDARNFFSPSKGKLRFNSFGWNFGGPIKKDRLFFFAGQEWKKIRRDELPSRVTLPTRANRAGDFNDRSSVYLKDPSKTGSCSSSNKTACFPDPKVLPASLMTADGKAIAKVYDAMEKLAASYVDTPTSNNTIYQMSNPFNDRQDLLRLDYRLNDKHSLYGRYVHDEYDLIVPFGYSSSSNLPTVPTNRQRPGTSYQLAYTWMARPTLINEAKVNAAWNGQRIPPVGDTWKRDTYGFTFPTLYATGGKYKNGIPDVSISGFANFRGPSFALHSPTTDISLADNLTWIRGAHSLKSGVLVVRNRKDQNGRTRYTGYAEFASGNTYSTGNYMADALLGNFRRYTEFASDPIGFFRFTQVEAFVSDNWRVSRRFNIEAGMRYYWGTPIYTQANNIVNFDPLLYDPAKAVTINKDGTILPGSGNIYNGLIRAGDGVPDSELGRIPNGKSPEVLSVPAGAPRGLYDNFVFFTPRFGFAWDVFGDSKTAIRGGYGFFPDRPEGNLIFNTVGIPPFSLSSVLENGNLLNPAGGKASALAPMGTINTIDPRLKTPYTMSWSVSGQREFAKGLLAEVAYVSNQGRHLIRQPDLNASSFEAQVANQALPSSQRLSSNALRPYKGYSTIRQRFSDSTSSYHAFQAYLNKRKGRLNLTASYTWSKVLTDSSSNSENYSAADDPFNRRYYRGPASFDRRHIFSFTYNYRVPFFSRSHGVIGAALGGWEVSGITRFQAGGWDTPTGSTSIGSRRADYVLGQDINLPKSERTVDRYFNTEAFTPAPDWRRGTAGVGIIQMPGLNLWDFSIRKQFRLREKTTLRFQADMFNAPNHANFRNPEVSVTSGSYGGIADAGPARNIQFGLKLNF